MDKLNELKIKIWHAINYLNDKKIDRDKLSPVHRIALESRLDTLADIAMIIKGNDDIDLTNIFWNVKGKRR
jgi:hypothetical protein